MTKLFDIEISQDDPAWTKADHHAVERAILAAVNFLGLEFLQPAEVSVLLTNDDAQRRLNKDWRNIDKSTNVLSFPQIEPFTAPIGLLGDISIAHATVQEEAKEQNKLFESHLTHLAVHAFLHILGYDHINDADALEMETREAEILRKLNIDDPYAPIEDGLEGPQD